MLTFAINLKRLVAELKSQLYTDYVLVVVLDQISAVLVQSTLKALVAFIV